jgi:multidrug transporter EmrE-like cation transporter
MGITNFAWWPWLLVVTAGFNTCAGNLLLKYSRQVAPDPGLVSLLFSPYFIGGLFFYGLNVILFAKALDVLPVSSAYPVLAGLGFLLISCTAFLFFGEAITLPKVFGMLLIMAGVVLLAR